MPNIEAFDKNNIGSFGDDMMKELNKVGARYGVKFSRKSIRYTPGDFRCTVTATIQERGEGVLTKAEKAYNHYGVTMRGLPPLGTQFYDQGVEMTIVGWNTRARKNYVQMKGSDGKTYVCPPDYVRHMAG